MSGNGKFIEGEFVAPEPGRWSVLVEPMDGGCLVTASQDYGGEIASRKVIVAGDPTDVRYNRKMQKALIGIVKEAFPKPPKAEKNADLPGQQTIPGTADATPR